VGLEKEIFRNPVPSPSLLLTKKTQVLPNEEALINYLIVFIALKMIDLVLQPIVVNSFVSNIIQARHLS